MGQLRIYIGDDMKDRKYRGCVQVINRNLNRRHGMTQEFHTDSGMKSKLKSHIKINIQL